MSPSRKKPIILVLASFLGIIISTSAVSQSGMSIAHAVTTTWSRTYGELSPSSVEQTSDSGYIVVGSDQFFKLDSDGDIEWAKAVEGFGGDLLVEQTSDGGYIVGGVTESFGVRNNEFWVLKLESDGDIEWEKAYGSDGPDMLRSIQQTSDSGYVLAGHTAGAHAPLDLDVWVVKLDSDGNIEWEKAYGGAFRDAALAVQQTSDGYIVGGVTDSFGAGGPDVWLLKLDSNGNLEWEKAYGGASGDAALAMRQTSDGGYIVGGVTESFGVRNNEFWVLKLESDGDIEWEKAYGSDGPDILLSIIQTSDEGYVAAGYASILGGTQAWATKLDSDGNIEWEQAYKGDILNSIHQTSDGGFVAAGITGSFGFDSNFWVIKLDSGGNIDSCITDDLVQETGASVKDTTAAITDTTADVQETSATVQETEAVVKDTSAKINIQCGPSPPPALDYGLELFENINEPSDWLAGLNQELRAVASTDDSSVGHITFRWISPGPELAREVTVPIATPENIFAPDEPGDWTVEVDFNNGQVMRKTLIVLFFVPYFVLPESPVGAVAMIVASMGAMGGFLYFRSKSRP